jgi:hypothetical protein
MPLDLTGNKLLSTSIGPKGEVIRQIASQGLLVHLDAANKNSYAGSGINWSDLSGNNRQGYVRGTPSFGSTHSGYLETSANQTTNYIELPESAPQNLTNGFIYTIDWWCTIKDTSAGRYQQSMVASNGANLFIVGKEASSFFIWNTSLVSGTAPTYEVNVPNHLVVTSNGTNQYFYKNGVLTSTWSAPFGDLKTTTGWIIDQEQDASKGAFDANQNTYGWWHIVRMYNKVLTASEVLQNYNSQKTRFGL